MKLDGRMALVTGATGGIGHAIARALAKNGARLLLTGRRADVLEPLARELGARALSVDLADRAALDRLIEESRDVDVLVANAALPASGRITDFEVAEIDAGLDVNLRAPILLARALVARMSERGCGSQGHRERRGGSRCRAARLEGRRLRRRDRAGSQRNGTAMARQREGRGRGRHRAAR